MEPLSLVISTFRGHSQGDDHVVWQHRGEAEQCVHQR
jgi:hypothetical protein